MQNRNDDKKDLKSKGETNKKPILAEKLDTAYAQYLHYESLLKKDQISTVNKQITITLRDQALQFLKDVLNTDNIKAIDVMMKDRERKKVWNPEYIPGKAVKLTSLPTPETARSKGQYHLRKLATLGLVSKRGKIMVVNSESRNKDVDKKTRMFNPVLRDIYRVIIKKGKFITVNAHDKENVDTSKNVSHTKKGYAAFVINPNGEISIFSHLSMQDKIAHSTFNAGASVVAAGELQIIDGDLKMLTVHSGHYQPKLNNVYECLKYFKQHGVDIANVNVRFFKKLDDAMEVKTVESPKDDLDDSYKMSLPLVTYKAQDLYDKYEQELLKEKNAQKNQNSSKDSTTSIQAVLGSENKIKNGIHQTSEDKKAVERILAEPISEQKVEDKMAVDKILAETSSEESISSFIKKI